MSSKAADCLQFAAHAWKKDVCKNCSKTRSFHPSTISDAGKSQEFKSIKPSPALKPEKPLKKPVLMKEIKTKVQVKSPELQQNGFSSQDPIYDIYDVTAKKIEDKLVISSRENSSVGTPYNVVDVVKKKLSRNEEESVNEFKRSNIEVDEYHLEELNCFSSELFKPRLYEEIDEDFLERVATMKKIKKPQVSKENQNQNSENLKIESDSNSLEEFPENKKVSKPEKRSFFKKWLNKNSKSEENILVDSSLKLVNKPKISDEVPKDEKENEKKCLPDLKYESSGRHESKKSLTSILSKKSNESSGINQEEGIGGSGDLVDGMSCCSEIKGDGDSHLDFKASTMLSSSADMLDNIHDKPNKSIHSRPKASQGRYLSSTMKKGDNRKSMSSAEARFTRKMLQAPPPPPTSSFSCSPKHHVMFTSATLSRTQQKHSDNLEDSSTTNKSSLLDGFMADLDAILNKKSSGDSKSLPRPLPADLILPQNKSETLPLSAASTTISIANFSLTTITSITSSTSSSVQQRVLPDIPVAQPTSPSLVSPDNDDLYEVLPPEQTKKQPPSLPLEKPRQTPQPAIRAATARHKKRIVQNSYQRKFLKLNISSEEGSRITNQLTAMSLRSLVLNLSAIHSVRNIVKLQFQEADETGEVGKKIKEEVIQRCHLAEKFSLPPIFFYNFEFCKISCFIMAQPSEENATYSEFEKNIQSIQCFYVEMNHLEEKLKGSSSISNHFMLRLLPFKQILPFKDFIHHHSSDKTCSLLSIKNSHILSILTSIISHLLLFPPEDKFIKVNQLLLCQPSYRDSCDVLGNWTPFLAPKCKSENGKVLIEGGLAEVLKELVTLNEQTKNLMKSKRQQQQQHPVPRFRPAGSSSANKTSDQDLRMINCLLRVEEVLEKGKVSDLKVVRDALDFSLWGPQCSDEEIRLTYIDPKRSDYLETWLTNARLEMIGDLINIEKKPSPRSLELLFEASFLERIQVEDLLNSIKMLYF